MNLQFFLFIFNTIICSNESSYVFKKLDSKILNLKIIDLKKLVCISIISQDCLMFDGYWFDKETCIFSDQFEIYGIKIHDYIQTKINSKYSLDVFMNDLVNRVFVFKTEKSLLNRTIEFQFKLFKKEDIRDIMTKYVNKISLIDDITEALNDFYEELQHHGTTYGIKFNKNNGEMLNFLEYELGVYKKAKEIKREKTMKSFKDPITAFAKHTLMSITIFGPFGFILVYLISKYLIKQ